MSTASNGAARERRFWSKVRGGDVDTCWLWTASVMPAGYGKFCTGRKDGRPVLASAHRWAYEALRTEIPDGLHIDHLCRNRLCVNPWHLEPVTLAENNRRAAAVIVPVTHCKQGHEYDEANTYRSPSGQRVCRACNRAAQARRKSRMGAAV